MRRQLVVAFAIVASVLVVTAMPVAGSHGPKVVSVHTTDADFGAATLTNMIVKGSGSSATVKSNGVDDAEVDDFEDGDVSEYSGDTTAFDSDSTAPVLIGSNSLKRAGDTTNERIISTAGLPEYPDQGENYSVYTYLEDSTSLPAMLWAVQDENNYYDAYIRADNDQIVIEEVDGGSRSTLTSQSDVTLNVDTWYEMELEWGTDNSITITVYAVDSNGDRTSQLGQATTSDPTLTDGGIGFESRSSSADHIWDFAYISGTEPDFPEEYLHNHSAENTVGGFVDITTLTNVTATVTYRGDSNGDGTYDTLLNQTSGITSAANHSFTWSEFPGDDVRLNLTVESAGTSQAFILESEGVEATGAAPSADDGSASPSGSTIEDNEATLSIPVEDPDFGTGQGDTVTVNFYLNGTQVDTQMITSNQTVSYNTGALGEGSHTWNVTLSDTYGHTASSSDHSFTVVHHPPEADNASATPDGTVLEDNEATLSIPVADGDFDDTTGDTVTVEFYVNGSLVDTQTISSNQTVTHTQGSLGNGSHTWNVSLLDEYGYRVDSQQFTFDVLHHSPEINNSLAIPTGDLSSEPSSFSIEAADGDFADSTGDTVTVEFFVNGQSSGTDGITANGTATVSATNIQGGSNEWYVVATDNYGFSTTSANFSFQSPANLSVYNETAVRINGTRTDAELVDEVEVEIRMLQDEDTLTIVTRTTNNGVINMSGLDATEPFIAVATADGYFNRRIFVSSLFDTQAIYLLPENQTAVTQEFDLQDFTGLYPQDDTVLEVQRALNGSWRTVEGDYFGATGEFSATLRFNARHRLVLTNIETGRSQVVGTYTPISAEDKVVKVVDDETIQLLSADPSVAFSPDVGAIPALSTNVDVTFDNQSTTLSSYDVSVIHNNASGSVTLATASGSSSGGETLSLPFDLTNRTGNVTVIANWSTTAGDSGSEEQVYSIREAFQTQHNLLTVLDTIPTQLPAASVGTFLAGLSIFLGILAIVASASVIRLSTEEAALTGVTVWAVTATIGWLSWNVVFATAIAWLALAARRRGF